MQTGDVREEHTISVRFTCLARRDALFATFHAAHEKAGTFRCKDTGIGKAAGATVVHAGQRAAIDRFGLPTSEEAE